MVSSSSLTVVSVPLLNPMFEQPEEGVELFSWRVKTGFWNVDCMRLDSDGEIVADAIERGGD